MKKQQAAFMAIIGGIAIFGIKLFAYFISNSVALLSDALESIVNITASGLMFFSVYVSEKPADDTHNYGHQKIEEISRMIEGLFIIIAAVLIINAAIGNLFESAKLVKLNLAIGISMLATSLNAGLSWFLGHTAEKSGSAALDGDAKHLRSDVVSSIGVWVGLFFVGLTGWSLLDPIIALIIAALISRMGVGLVLKSSYQLMDQSCKKEEEKIREVLLRHRPSFKDFHKVKTRRQGNQVFAELHLLVESSISVEDAHNLTDHLEEELRRELHNMDLTIHIEPLRNNPYLASKR